jgi:hypothetical protein
MGGGQVNKVNLEGVVASVRMKSQIDPDDYRMVVHRTDGLVWAHAKSKPCRVCREDLYHVDQNEVSDGE